MNFSSEDLKENIIISNNELDQYSKEEIINKAVTYHCQGNITEAIKYYQYCLYKEFNDPIVFSNYGLILIHNNEKNNAIKLFKRLIELYPNNPDGYSRLGALYNDINRTKEAEWNICKAIEINPNNSTDHSNLGSILIKNKKFKQAEDSIRKAIELNPNNHSAHSNLGLVLNQISKTEEAELSVRKAIQLKNNFVDAYINLGNILLDKGDVNESINTFKKALTYQPDNPKTLFGLFTCCDNINDAEKYLKKCLEKDNQNIKAKVFLASLKVHQKESSLLNELIDSSIKDNSLIRSIKWVMSLDETPDLYFNRWSLFDKIIGIVNQDRPFYEFGVWRGVSFKFLINTFKKGYGFDTFDGLPEDWDSNIKKGTYSSDGIIPKIKGGTFIVGKFEDTLPKFFAKKRPMASIINFDADLYSSTICALNFSKAVIDENTVLIFDEFITNKNWEQDEYKALNEFCLNNNLKYKVIAISYITKQVAVKLLAC